MKQAVGERRLDQAVSVRQAVMDLVGKYILYKPEFAPQYYPLIVDRIAVGGSFPKRFVCVDINYRAGQRQERAKASRQDPSKHM